MNGSEEVRNPVECLAEEFVERCRRGEHPSVSEYADAHPEWAEQIRQMFPTLLALEDFRSDRDGSTGHESPWRPPLQILEQLGDFRILRSIGRGGMGVVYEAEQQSLGRRVAIKVLADGYATSPQAVRRFRREAQAAARLHHSNIVSVFGVGECDGKHFYVMQFVEGQSLDRVVDDLIRIHRGSPAGECNRRSDAVPDGESTESFPGSAVARALFQGKFASTSRTGSDEPPAVSPDHPQAVADDDAGILANPDANPSRLRREQRPAAYWRSVAGLGMQVGSALHYAHRQGILHRDIKPSNLILDDRGVAWITDFGLAKVVDQEDLTNPGDVVGTLRYMAPEQLEGRASVQSDVYGLGLTLYELLTLRPAFDETSRHGLLRQVSQQQPPPPRSIAPDVPRDLETIVLKTLAREPVHRYAAAGELADDLQRFLDDRPIRARRATAIEHVWRWCRRNPALAGLTATTVLLLALWLVGASAGYLRESALRARAEAEQRRAETNLAIAAEAFEDVFTRLSGTPSPQVFDPTSQQLWLGDAGSPVVAKRDALVLEGLLKFYERFAEQNRDSTKWQQEIAQANRRVGDIQQRLGRFPEARDAYQRALEVYGDLARRLPNRPAYLVELAAAHSQLGSLARWDSQFDQALREYGQAREILTRGEAAIADSPAGRFELARVCRELGLVAILRQAERSSFAMEAGDAADAETSLLQAVRILTELVDEAPANGGYRLALVESYENLWGYYRLTGRDESAAESETAAIGILRALLAESPENPEYRHALARFCAMTKGSPLADPADTDVALLQEAADLLEQTVTDYPDIPDYRRTLGLLHNALAEARYFVGPNGDSVEQAFHRSIELFARLHDEFPNITHYRLMLGRSLYGLAVAQNQRQQPEAARANIERLIALFASADPPDTDNPLAAALLAHAYSGLADLLDQAGESAEALGAAELARRHAKSAPPRMLQMMSPRLGNAWSPDRQHEASRPDRE